MRTSLEPALGSAHAWRAACARRCLRPCSRPAPPPWGPRPVRRPRSRPQAARPGQRAPVKIALLLPLGGMGETAAVAKSMKQAAEMALFEVNDPNVQLVTKDDGGTAAGGRAAADAAIKEGAEIILGPLFSQAAAGAAPVARQAGVPILAFSNDTQGRRQRRLPDELPRRARRSNRVVSFAARQGKRRFAALIPDNAYGNVVEPAFRRAVAAGGRHGRDPRALPARRQRHAGAGQARRRGDQARRGAAEPGRRPVPAGRPGRAAADRPRHRLQRPRYEQGEAAGHRRLGLPLHRPGRRLRRRLVPEPRPHRLARFAERFAKTFGKRAAAHRQRRLRRRGPRHRPVRRTRPAPATRRPTSRGRRASPASTASCGSTRTASASAG